MSQSGCVRKDKSRGKDRKENVDAEGEIRKSIRAAFPSQSLDTGASTSSASQYPAWSQWRNNSGGYVWQLSYLQCCFPRQRQSAERSQLSLSQSLGWWAVWAKSWSQWSQRKFCQWEHTLSFSPHLWLPYCWKHSECMNDSNGKEKEQSSHVPPLLVLFPENPAAQSKAMSFSLNDIGLNCLLKITEEEEGFGNQSFSFKEWFWECRP